MINESHRFAELEEKILRGSDLPEPELEELAGTLRGQVVSGQTRDLAAYRERRTRQDKERERSELSLLEQIASGVKRALGFTEARYAHKVLANAQALETLFGERITGVEGLLDERTEQHQEASKKHMQSEMYFTAVQQQYRTRQQQVDRLEAELEVLQAQSGRSITVEVYQMRERLGSAKRDMLSLRKDADHAMAIYTSSAYEDRALQTQVERFQHDLTELNAQRSEFSMRVSAMQVDNLVQFGTKGEPSVRQLYEDIGIYAQRMDAVMKRHGRDAARTLDGAYAIGAREHESDPLVARWLKMRSE